MEPINTIKLDDCFAANETETKNETESIVVNESKTEQETLANSIVDDKNIWWDMQKNENEHEKEITTVTQETNKNITTLKNELSLEQYLLQTEEKITDTKKRLRFLKRWESREVKNTVKHIIKRLEKAEDLIDKFKRYERKFGREDIKAKHIQAMCIKLNTILADSNDYVSQGITGDLDEANKFFPPNFFDDAGYYTPDVVPSNKTLTNQVGNINNKWDTIQDNTTETNNDNICKKTNEVVADTWTLEEQFSKNGALWALNAGLESAGAGVEMRGRAYKVGNLVRSATKVFGTLRAWWKFLKSSYDATFGKGKFSDVAKYGGMLAWWYVLWPSIDKLVRWWDTSQQAAELFWLATGKKLTKTEQQDKELEMDAKVSAGLFETTPRKDWKIFTDDKGVINFEALKGYLFQKEWAEWSRYKLLEEITQSNNTARVQNFLTDMWINSLYIAQKIKNNPEETITKTYEEAQKRWNEIAEKYDRNDAANIKPTLDKIEQKMILKKDNNFVSFKEKRMDMERELNVLYTKHPKAKPISIAYNEESQQLEVGSYKQKTQIDLWVSPWIRTPYNTEQRKTTDHNEAIRMGNLMNFLTDPQSQITKRSQVDQPFHISTIGDIEFLKADRRESTKQLNKDGNLKDISVLNESFLSSDTKRLYPSIANNKQEFVNWLNNCKINGKSIWKT